VKRQLRERERERESHPKQLHLAFLKFFDPKFFVHSRLGLFESKCFSIEDQTGLVLECDSSSFCSFFGISILHCIKTSTKIFSKKQSFGLLESKYFGSEDQTSISSSVRF
jgi:hypothetical protein